MRICDFARSATDSHHSIFWRVRRKMLCAVRTVLLCETSRTKAAVCRLRMLFSRRTHGREAGEKKGDFSSGAFAPLKNPPCCFNRTYRGLRHNAFVLVGGESFRRCDPEVRLIGERIRRLQNKWATFPNWLPLQASEKIIAFLKCIKAFTVSYQPLPASSALENGQGDFFSGSYVRRKNPPYLLPLFRAPPKK